MQAVAKKISSTNQSAPKRTAVHTHPLSGTSISPFNSHDSNTSIQQKPTCACGGGCPRCQEKSHSVQTRLRISSSGDSYEQEADRIADQVVNGEKVNQPLSTLSSQVQRKPLETGEQEQEQGEEEEAKPEFTLQPKLQGAMAGKDVSLPDADLKSLQGKGEGLPGNLRSDFENRMGYDFNHVRVHKNAQAASLAQKLNARAFTLGSNVVFAQNQYQPTNNQGKHLLAHELTHVVQQSGSTARCAAINNQVITPSKYGVQRKVDPKTKLPKKKGDMVDGDYIVAIKYVNKAIQKLGEKPYKPEVVRALKLYFNISGYEHQQTLLSNLKVIRYCLTSYKKEVAYKKAHPLECETTEDGATAARARPASMTDGKIWAWPPVKLCPVYLDEGDQAIRVRTLIHEHAHVAGLIPPYKTGTEKREKEFRVGDKDRFIVTSKRLLRSADSYAYLVMGIVKSSPVSMSVGAATGVVGGFGGVGDDKKRRRAAGFVRFYIDLSPSVPILKVFYPYARFAVTIMATKKIGPNPPGKIRWSDSAYIFELLGGTRIQLRKSVRGANWYISIGGGIMFVLNDILDEKGEGKLFSVGGRATLAGVLRIKNLEFKASASYLNLPKVPGFKHSFQGGLTIGYRF